MKIARCFFWLVFCVLPLLTQAETYGFVDEKGIVHLAKEKLDARYELYFRGETTREFKLSSELKFRPGPGHWPRRRPRHRQAPASDSQRP